MLILRIISYICFGIASVGIVLAIGEVEVMLLAMSVSTAIAGVLMLALDKIVTTLTEIRDSIASPRQAVGAVDILIDKPTENSNQSTPARSLKEISVDIERMKSKL